MGIVKQELVIAPMSKRKYNVCCLCNTKLKNDLRANLCDKCDQITLEEVNEQLDC